MTPPQLANERVALYRRVLGEAWDSLPEPLRAMHDLDGERSADGVAVVERGSGLLARLVAFVIGLPPAGADIPVTVSFRAEHGREHWQRNFAGRVFSSVQAQGRGRFESLVCERFGLLNVGMAPVRRERTPAARGPPLEHVRRPAAAGVGATREFIRVRAGGAFSFHVEIAHPFTGLIVRYRGWLVPRA